MYCSYCSYLIACLFSCWFTSTSHTPHVTRTNCSSPVQNKKKTDLSSRFLLHLHDVCCLSCRFHIQTEAPKHRVERCDRLPGAPDEEIMKSLLGSHGMTSRGQFIESPNLETVQRHLIPTGNGIEGWRFGIEMLFLRHFDAVNLLMG